MILTADELAYRARALAQAHPLTALAKKVVDRSVEAERPNFPFPEAGVWASSGMIKGYCVRRVEEDDSGLTLGAGPEESLPGVERLESETGTVMQALRATDGAGPYLVGDEDRMLEALDAVIGSEIRNRLDNMQKSTSSGQRRELEDYLAYWVIKGYALRAAERSTGALAEV